jgi:hypothetical protein
MTSEKTTYVYLLKPGCLEPAISKAKDPALVPGINCSAVRGAIVPRSASPFAADWADAILEEPLQIQDGLARVRDRPGIGLTWRSEAVKALSLDR